MSGVSDQLLLPDPEERIRALTGRTFDVLVIGGGIHGAALACRAAQAGWSVALIEKDDFGGAASANSLKILHGGLRYLQQLDMPRMRESIAARRDGLASLPHLAHPASFLAPARGSLKRSRAAYRVAACLNDLVSFDRNRGIPPSHMLPRTRVLSATAFHEALRGAAVPGDGALQWSDGFVENTERYTLAYVMTARGLGAATANYVRATGLLREAAHVTGATAMCGQTGRTFDIRARVTVNAAGAWISDLVPGGARSTPPAAWVRAWNLVVDRNWFGPLGVGIDNGERNFFFAPWRGGTIIGTAYDVFRDRADACRLSPADLAAFVHEVNTLWPEASLKYDDVTFAHAGVLPAKTMPDGTPVAEPSGKTRVFDYAADGIEGFIALLGVKYTTGAWWADRLVPLLARKLGQPAAATPGALYGNEEPMTADKLAAAASSSGWSMRAAIAQWLVSCFGARSRHVLALGLQRPEWQATLTGTEIPLAAIAYAVRHEQAVHLDDIVFRRTDVGTFRRPGSDTLQQAATTMAACCGWDHAAEQEELKRVDNQYRRVGILPA